MSTKNHQKSATKLHCLKTSSGKVVAQSSTYRKVSTFWQEWPGSHKIWAWIHRPPLWSMCVLSPFARWRHMRRTVESAL